ncbi:mechanosensitive ion channel family protein [Peptoniphilus sp. oral taxon 386]|uniref:mechanosensitive ion channel family protein n=1 Tax=Peptoniphilus sp. oral taxon 386 TaxID=652713 RepID=UPI0001DA9A24|nr:mechanosensitive ion channel family protein [Peptoniphilus sp. oral taxon 386]EFI41854.1 transporter, small conductance mechanosensitive ion channel MscS family protein [Peptoniphilus sp. oral taxon 386 str. F0131]
MEKFENVMKYLKAENGNLNFLGKIFEICIIFLVAYLFSLFISFIIKKNLHSQSIKKHNSYMRIVTITNLFIKMTKIIIYFLAVMLTIEVLGFNSTSLFATLGVGSIAISFGAQNLVKDVINGVFIIAENQYSVGDLVEISNYQGYIEDIGIRCTKLRDFAGELYIIPNGKIGIVTNKQRGDMRAKIVFPVSIKEEPKNIIELIRENIGYLKDDDRILKGPDVWGVTNNTDRGYEITVAVYAKPGEQFKVEYEIRQKVVEAFIKNKVELPIVKAEVNQC